LNGREEVLQYVRYVDVGLRSLIVFFGISFTLSELFGVWYQLAYTTAFVVATSIRFALTKKAFRNTEGEMKSKFILFFAITFVFFVLNSLTLHHMVENWYWDRVRSQIVLACIPWAPFYYLVNRKIFLGYYLWK
jgi:putative flippase GtrA